MNLAHLLDLLTIQMNRFDAIRYYFTEDKFDTLYGYDNIIAKMQNLSQPQGLQ